MNLENIIYIYQNKPVRDGKLLAMDWRYVKSRERNPIE